MPTSRLAPAGASAACKADARRVNEADSSSPSGLEEAAGTEPAAPPPPPMKNGHPRMAVSL